MSVRGKSCCEKEKANEGSAERVVWQRERDVLKPVASLVWPKE